MSFHKKILLAFFLFHLFFTVGDLVFDYLLASAGTYADSGIRFSMVLDLKNILTLALPIILIALAYVSRYVWVRVHQRQQSAASRQI